MNKHQHEPGQPVHVYAFGSWRTGTVLRCERGRVWVRYVRNRFGDIDEKVFLPVEVLDAAGVVLVSARELQPGQVVLTIAGGRTVRSVRWARRSRVVIGYTDGDEVVLYSRTRLRVRTSESTPARSPSASPST